MVGMGSADMLLHGAVSFFLPVPFALLWVPSERIERKGRFTRGTQTDTGYRC